MKKLFDPVSRFYAALFAVVLLSCLAGCRDQEDPPPTLDEQLQGAWTRNWLTFTDTYSFDGHWQCLMYAIIPGQPVQFYAYKYSCEGNTLTMTDLASAGANRTVRRAVVTFSEDGDTATLGWLDGVNYVLTRI